jgi:hypothetical protein
MLGLFCIWTESALVERRLGLLSVQLDRRARLDDPLPFSGAILGVVAVAALGPVSGMARAAALPASMALGAFAACFARGLDSRGSLLAALLVVENGTGGAILRVAITLAVWVNVLRGAGA